MMNDKQLEAAARRYCELLGLDPDAAIAQEYKYQGGSVPVIHHYTTPHWKLIADKIRSEEALREAIDFGRSQEP